MNIIKASMQEFDIVKEITRETIQAIYPHYYAKGAVDFFLNHHNDENIKNDITNGIVYVLQVENHLVGTVTVREDEICRLFVLPKYQGNGYGRVLLDYAEGKALENFDEIIIDASLPAKAIYKKRGYIETEYHMIATEIGDFLCYDVMKKQGG